MPNSLPPLDPITNNDPGPLILDKMNLAFAKIDNAQDFILSLSVFQALNLTGLPDDLNTPVPHNATFKDAINWLVSNQGDIGQLPSPYNNIIDVLNYINNSRGTEISYGLIRLATQTEVNNGQIHESVSEHAVITPFTLANITANSPLANALTNVIQATAPSNQATETEQGMAQLATSDEMNDGLSDQVMITPLKLKNLTIDSVLGKAIANQTPIADELLFGRIKIASLLDLTNETSDENAVTPLKLSTWFNTKIATENAVGVMRVATTTQTATGTSDNTVITPLKLLEEFESRNASTIAPGLIEIADNNESITGTNGVLAITPATLNHVLTNRLATDIISGTIFIATQAEITLGTDNSKALTALTYKNDIDPIKQSVATNTNTISTMGQSIASNDTDIQNIQSNKANKSIQINAGTGLSGGGNLGSNTTINMDLNSLDEDISPSFTDSIIMLVGGVEKRVPILSVPRLQKIISQIDVDFSTTSTSYVSTGLSISVVPKSTASKFKLTIGGIVSADIASDIEIDIFKDGVSILTGSATSFMRYTQISNVENILNIITEHNPASAVSVTYEIKIKTSANTVYLGRSGIDATHIVPTTFILEEIM